MIEPGGGQLQRTARRDIGLDRIVSGDLGVSAKVRLSDHGFVYRYVTVVPRWMASQALATNPGSEQADDRGGYGRISIGLPVAERFNARVASALLRCCKCAARQNNGLLPISAARTMHIQLHRAHCVFAITTSWSMSGLF
jgi:hypothetical protein